MPKPPINRQEFLKIAAQVHGELYDYDKTKQKCENGTIEIVCRKHGSFWSLPRYHLRGFGCRSCSYEKGASSFVQRKAKEFIARSLTIHGEKYDYSKTEYVGSETTVVIGCPRHGFFEQLAKSHVRGHGCVKCAADAGKKIDRDTFIRLASKRHAGKYDYSKALVRVEGKVEIVCQEHGSFWQPPDAHMRGNGCPRCIGRGRTTEEFIRKARESHGDFYDYSKTEYQGASVKLQIGCRTHGAFWQLPHSHFKGHGCQQCNSGMKFSKMAVLWLEEEAKRRRIRIRHAGNTGEYKLPGSKLYVDGFCKGTNTVFEFHGDAWHGNPKVFSASDKPHPHRRDITAKQLLLETRSREKAIRRLGYNLIVMWENDFRSL